MRAPSTVAPASRRLRFLASLQAVFLALSCGYLLLTLNDRVNPYSVVYNGTASVPLGFYLAKELRGAAVRHGDIACFGYRAPHWAAGRNYFPEGFRLCKYVAGLPGDQVAAEEGAVTVIAVERQALTVATLAQTDSQGRQLPQDALKPGVIGAGQVALIAPRYANSFDSRYLGLIESRALSHRLVPILTW